MSGGSRGAGPTAVLVQPVGGIGEVLAGADLGAVIGAALVAAGVRDGDIIAVTSKVISKAFGLTSSAPDRRAVVAQETAAVVAERMTSTGATRIVQGHHGVVMAAAGVDASNVGPSGALLLLPHDPDQAANDLLQSLTEYLRLTLGQAPDLGIVLTDTAGRPWRGGQTDFALGAAGLRVLVDYRGQEDTDGRPMEVTAVAVADEIAAAADLVKGKISRTPVAIVRGLAHLVDPSTAGGARRLVRTGPSDFFAMGHIEAARAALGVAPGSPLAETVGIRAIFSESIHDRLARAVRVALGTDGAGPEPVRTEVSDGLDSTVEISPSITLTGTDDYAVGRAVARLEVALWSESLDFTLHARSPGRVTGTVASR